MDSNLVTLSLDLFRKVFLPLDTTTISTNMVVLLAGVLVGSIVMVVRIMVEGFNLMVGILLCASSAVLGVTPQSLVFNVEP